MDRFDTSNKIICLIEMAFKGEITWLNLDLLIDGLTPNLERSRQIIRILLKEFETHQSKCLMNTSNNAKSISDDVIEIDEIKTILGSNQEEIIQNVEEKKSVEQVTNIEIEYSKTTKHVSMRKTFECETCGKCFRSNYDLKVHVSTHTGEKPYVCKTCTKGFAQSCDLKRHERMHTGEKPYICTTCKKGFVDSSALKRHERSHTGEIPFPCKSCNKSFSHSHRLKKHQKVHTM